MKFEINGKGFGVKIAYLLFVSFFSFIAFLYPQQKNDLLAMLLIVTNILMVVVTRRNQISSFISFILLFFNLSISLSDYTFQINQIKWNSLVYYNNGHYYQEALVMLLVFNLIFFIALNTEEYKYKPISIHKKNTLLFWLFYLSIILVLIFGIDRGGYGIGYEVRITPIFEYSIILFLMCYIFSDKVNKIHSRLIILLAITFVVQDALYGGRITSIQLLIFLGFSFFYEFLKIRNLLIFFFFAIIFFSYIGQIRSGDNFGSFSLLKSFINDTATYAYGSSTTHLFAADQTDWNTRIMSFIFFLLSFVFPLTNDMEILSNVTLYSQRFHINIGGGMIFSHLYFWGGFPLLIFFAFVFTRFLNKRERVDGNLNRGILLLLVCYFPRLYLYSPKAGLRAALVIFPIFWMIFNKIDVNIEGQNFQIYSNGQKKER